MIKNPKQIEIMAEAGKRLSEILGELVRDVKVGVTTKHFDERSRVLMREAGVVPAFLGYRPYGAERAFPAALCVSVNETVVHGLPSRYELRSGDIVKLDIGIIHQGFYADMAVTLAVGKVDSEKKELIKATCEALARGIAAARSEGTLGDIGSAIEHVVRSHGFSVVESLSGHGIGRKLHEEPYVLNYGESGKGLKLRSGMVLAIEPMVARGSGRVICVEDDSYVTADGSPSAHFEQTVVITDAGPRILTPMPDLEIS